MTGRTFGWWWLLICPAIVAWGQTGQSDKPISTTAHAAIGASIKQLAEDLKEARGLLDKVPDKPTRERLELLITRSELKAIELEKSLAGALPGSAPIPISADDFARLLKGIKGESFDDGKVSFVTTFAASSRLSCEQARELLKSFSFDEGRERATVVLYPRLTDPERFFTVLEVFTFDSSRNSVREKLNLIKK